MGASVNSAGMDRQSFGKPRSTGNKRRANPGTTRYRFEFDKAKGGRREPWEHSLRGTFSQRAAKELRAFYRKDGYTLENLHCELIENSEK
jgi:hypothetical protein